MTSLPSGCLRLPQRISPYRWSRISRICRSASVTSASRRSHVLVRGAWLLDAAGDVGNRQQIEAAYSTFSAGVADIVARFNDAMRRASRTLTACALVALALTLASEPGRAHKPITSPFTYNDDVFPILKDTMLALPCRRRRGADVADDVRRHGAVGRVDSRRVTRGSHAAVGRRCGADALSQRTDTHRA